MFLDVKSYPAKVISASDLDRFDSEMFDEQAANSRFWSYTKPTSLSACARVTDKILKKYVVVSRLS
jgi:hypothetical protein